MILKFAINAVFVLDYTCVFVLNLAVHICVLSVLTDIVSV